MPHVGHPQLLIASKGFCYAFTWWGCMFEQINGLNVSMSGFHLQKYTGYTKAIWTDCAMKSATLKQKLLDLSTKQLIL